MDLFTLYRRNIKQQSVYLDALANFQDSPAQAELSRYAREHEYAASCIGQLLAAFGNIHLADLDVEAIRLKIELMPASEKKTCLEALALAKYEIDELFDF